MFRLEKVELLTNVTSESALGRALSEVQLSSNENRNAQRNSARQARCCYASERFVFRLETIDCATADEDYDKIEKIDLFHK